MDYQIEHTGIPEGGRFYIKTADRDLAEMTYMIRHKLMIINHTEVDDLLRGKGIGKNLVIRGIEYARENGLKILPLCSYAGHIINRNPAFHDVL